MRYKIHLNTEDPEIIEAFEKIGERSKGKFVEKALVFFLASKKGKDTVEIMSKGAKETKKEKKVSKGKDDKTGEDTQPKIKGPISIDKFL